MIARSSFAGGKRIGATARHMNSRLGRSTHWKLGGRNGLGSARWKAMGAAEGAGSPGEANREAQGGVDCSKVGFPPAKTGRAEEAEEPRERQRGSLEGARLSIVLGLGGHSTLTPGSLPLEAQAEREGAACGSPPESIGPALDGPAAAVLEQPASVFLPRPVNYPLPFPPPVKTPVSFPE